MASTFKLIMCLNRSVALGIYSRRTVDSIIASLLNLEGMNGYESGNR